MKPKIQCTAYTAKRLNDAEQQELSLMLLRALRADENLAEFYALAKEDKILQHLLPDLCGMHTIAWPELFPALILAVSLQMAPMKRSNQMMDLLMQHFGEGAEFDHKIVRYWPSPERIATTSVDELKIKAKLGYRAQNLVAIAQALQQGFPTMDKLYAMEPTEAKQKLLNLRGIGYYSAELIMPSMGFPLDVGAPKSSASSSTMQRRRTRVRRYLS